MSATILDKIKAYKLEHVAACKAAIPLAEVEARANDAPPTRGFADRLIEATKNGYGLIAEIKKAIAEVSDPSLKGWITEEGARAAAEVQAGKRKV